VRVVQADSLNVKITRPVDLRLAELLLLERVG
jgi:2-C-methyl-D-erythritol 4-phosphate cytidylyltransferase